MASGDIKLVYASSVDLTIGLHVGPLASDTTFLIGRQSTEIDNTSNLYADSLLGGKITTGTGLTTGREIRIYVVGTIKDAVYPDAFSTTDANRTITTVGTRDSAARLAAVIATVATSNQDYYFGPISVAALFGGRLPKKFVVWVVQNTAGALNGTAGNHVLTVTGIYDNVAA